MLRLAWLVEHGGICLSVEMDPSTVYIPASIADKSAGLVRGFYRIVQFPILQDLIQSCKMVRYRFQILNVLPIHVFRCLGYDVLQCYLGLLSQLRALLYAMLHSPLQKTKRCTGSRRDR